METLNQKVKLFRIMLEKDIRPSPGQFIMFWAPGIGEIPLSVSDYVEGLLDLVVARVGRVTGWMHDNIKPGDLAAVRGPYGSGFTVSGGVKCLLVAGGVGLAPLVFLARRLSESGSMVDVVAGFKCAEESLPLDRLRRFAARLIVASEAGDVGVKGTALDAAKRLLDLKRYDMVYVCGREAMILAVVTECVSRGLKCEASLERLVKCGVGLCGTCVIDPLGVRVCRDGPVFSGDEVLKMTDLGRCWRGPNGAKMPLKRGAGLWA